ncbi:site-specific integrase [Tsukamurella sp. 8F]|uniref:tyrosine-type recombinase/integrase n=1 Tax=unclassified Tsukamurella TaxID=2633480 RepID=UPI0023B905D6|nr:MULTISPECIES: site-specific integrase [unclassified Tsukamurella]MDF0532535.1 site-specific integrase [Tsukamurella sp. 8J]MDF0588105.1 site-specific integrase [Tsukamurella sp. 8F]
MTDTPEPAARRTRRAEPINKHTAKSGAVSYYFQIDVGAKPDGTRDRQRFTYPNKKLATAEFRRISAEVASGRFSRQTTLTVSEACEEWLAGRRGVREVTLRGYAESLKAAQRYLGGKKLAALTKADGDALVEWMLTEGRTSPRHYRPDSLAGRITALVSEHPAGVTLSEIKAAQPGDDVSTALAGLVRSGRVIRPSRGVYAPAAPESASTRGGVKPISARATLRALTAVVQSYVDQGALPRNVIALVERPKDEYDDHTAENSGSRTHVAWSPAEVEVFRASVAESRIYALWLLSMYALRRSEVMGLRWSAIDLDQGTLSVVRGRVAVGTEVIEGRTKAPKRSDRTLPLPDDLAEALRSFKVQQKREALAVGVPWSGHSLVAVREDGEPISPGWYSAEFDRLRAATGQRRITLKGLRASAESAMLARNVPLHVAAAWCGHSETVALAHYARAQEDDLRRAGSALFG